MGNAIIYNRICVRQNLCLEDVLTIKEIFEYYGTLYSMTKNQIECRIKTLNKVLQLPDLNQYIQNIRYVKKILIRKIKSSWILLRETNTY